MIVCLVCELCDVAEDNCVVVYGQARRLPEQAVRGWVVGDCESWTAC